MFTVLDGSGGDVLGVEISGGYTREDVAAFKAAFEKVLAAGHARVNVLVKLDAMSLRESEFMAFVQDARYAMSHLRQIRHIAVVGHGLTQEFLVKMDNAVFGSPKEELVERFFETSDMARAWEFVRS